MTRVLLVFFGFSSAKLWLLKPRNTNGDAYKTLVRPQLVYAAPIWHSYHNTETEMVEKAHLRLQPGGPVGNGGSKVASAIC